MLTCAFASFEYVTNATPLVLRTRAIGGQQGVPEKPKVAQRTSLNLTPFRKVPRHDLLDVVGDMYPADVDRPVLALEASHAIHVVSVVGVLVSSEAVDVRVEHVVNAGQSVEKEAVLALGAIFCQYRV